MHRRLLFAITSVALLTFPNVNFGQAPDLGTASGFAIFTAVGAVDNIGATTYITGNIGTNAGAFTGFPPGTVVGQVHVADVVSSQAATDVNVAYTYLSGIACDSVLGPTLGDNQLLTPKVYCLGSASTLNGNLTLDGQGDPDALFIFKIDGAFSTSTFTNVILINAACWCNVYWQVNGAFALGDSSVFRGTVVANGAIRLLEGSSLQGRGLSRAGAISLFNNAVTLEIPPVLLPVTLANFSATRQGGSTLLQWSTATEQNSKNFIVERSSSAKATTWETIGTLPAAGSSTTERQYSMMDNDVIRSANYYRLRSTNANGTHSLSNVKVIYFGAASATPAKAFPNPVKSSVTVTGVKQGCIIILLDMAGKKLKEQLAGGNGTDQVVTSHLASGIYLVKIISADGSTDTIKLNKY